MEVVPKDLKKLAAADLFAEFAQDRIWDSEGTEIGELAEELLDEGYPDGDWSDEHEAYEDRQAEIVDELWRMFIGREYARLQEGDDEEADTTWPINYTKLAALLTEQGCTSPGHHIARMRSLARGERVRLSYHAGCIVFIGDWIRK